jgi:hypothetical protein
LSYWEALRSLAEPFELMKFTLIYDGDLPASANRSKTTHVSRIRDQFHDQLADLWESHIVLRQLARTARTRPNPGAGYLVGREPIWSPPVLPEYNDPIPPLMPGQTDLCAPIQVPNSAAYLPLIRKSLNLACAVDILFLRHEDPGSLILQGGDIDGRIKTLFDASRRFLTHCGCQVKMKKGPAVFPQQPRFIVYWKAIHLYLTCQSERVSCLVIGRRNHIPCDSQLT